METRSYLLHQYSEGLNFGSNSNQVGLAGEDLGGRTTSHSLRVPRSATSRVRYLVSHLLAVE